MVAMMARKRRGGVMVDREESEDISKDKVELSEKKGKIQGMGGAEITRVAYKQLEDIKGG